MIHFFLVTFLIVLTNGCNKDEPVNPTPQEPLITQVGISTGTSVTSSIDVSGGSLTSTDGILQLIVPAGAVPAATIFTIQPVSNYCPGGYGLSYRLLPEGVTFLQPVTIIFSYPDTLPGDEDFLKIAYQDDDHTWFAPKIYTLNTANNTASVQTKHFSDWSLFLRLAIEPFYSNVKVGESRTLSVTFVGELNTITDAQGVELNNLNFNPTISTTWQVTAGTIAKDGDDKATYTAPSSVPSQNPVEVSVTFNNVSFTFHGQTFINPKLNARINVFDSQALYHVVFTSSRIWQPVADSWFTETDMGNLKVLVQGDSVTVYDILNINAEVLPGSLYDPDNECTYTLFNPGDGSYHIPDSIPLSGFYLSATHSVYIGVSGIHYPTGITPYFEKDCNGGSHDEIGGDVQVTYPAAFSFTDTLEYQEMVQVIPGGGAFPDGFLKTAVTKIQ